MILTTGGTGVALRDVTPEAVREIAVRELPGFGEVMQAASMKLTPNAILSRNLAVVVDKTLVICLPGKPSAAVECLGFVAGAIPHCIEVPSAASNELLELTIHRRSSACALSVTGPSTGTTADAPSERHLGFVLGMSQQEDEADLMAIEQVYLVNGSEFLLGFVENGLIAMGGFKTASTTTAELRRMRIAQPVRGRGYGTQLLRRAGRSGLRLRGAEAHP